MKTVTRQVLFTAILATVVLDAQTSQAEQQELVDRVQELQIQQVQIAANQTRAESGLAELKETVRVARIHASRAGGKHKPRPSLRK